MFFIDPEQKPALKLFLKTTVALVICALLLILTGVEAWRTLLYVWEEDEDIGFFDALSISLFLTFLIYGVLVALDPETILGRYVIVWFLLGLKTVFTMSLISQVF